MNVYTLKRGGGGGRGERPERRKEIERASGQFHKTTNPKLRSCRKRESSALNKSGRHCGGMGPSIEYAYGMRRRPIGADNRMCPNAHFLLTHFALGIF